MSWAPARREAFDGDQEGRVTAADDSITMDGLVRGRVNMRLRANVAVSWE